MKLIAKPITVNIEHKEKYLTHELWSAHIYGSKSLAVSLRINECVEDFFEYIESSISRLSFMNLEGYTSLEFKTNEYRALTASLSQDLLRNSNNFEQPD